MVDPQNQSLCIADGNVHPGQRLAGFRGHGFFGKVSLNMRFDAFECRIRIGMHNGVGVQQALRKLRIGRSFMVGQVGYSQAASSRSFGALPGFNGDEHGRLSHVPPSAIEQLIALFCFLVRSEIAVVQLNFPGKHHRLIRLAHRLADFLHHVPNRLITLQPQPLLHVLRRNRFRRTRHQEHAGVPRVDGQLAVRHGRSAPNGGLRSAIHAFPAATRRKPAHALGVTSPARQSIFFAKGSHVVDAAGLIREAFEKFVGRHGVRFETKSTSSHRNPFTSYIQTDKHYGMY